MDKAAASYGPIQDGRDWIVRVGFEIAIENKILGARGLAAEQKDRGAKKNDPET
jgi:hypothetical protein